MKDIENVPKQTYKKTHLKENNETFIQISHRKKTLEMERGLK